MLTRATSRFNYNLENLSGDASQLAHPDEAAFHDAEVDQDDKVVRDLQNDVSLANQCYYFHLCCCQIEEEDGSFSQGHQDSQSSQSSSGSSGYDDSTEDGISSEDEDGTEDGTEIGLPEDVNGGLDETEAFEFGCSQESRSLDSTNNSVSVSQVRDPLFLPSSSQECECSAS